MDDLRTHLQDKVAAGIAKLGTIRVACTYYKTGAAVYNETTGAYSETVDSTHSVDAIFSEFGQTRLFSTEELPDEQPVLSIDKLVLIARKDFAIEASVNDVILNLTTNETWRVLGVGSDPADAHYSLHVRPF